MSRQFSIYTPSLHEIDDLETRLIGAKRRYAERTVAGVRMSALDGGCHHFLFVGPRGIGKTHLLSVCFHRLRNDEALRPRVALAWLREEHYGIASAGDLYRRVIDAIKADDSHADVPEGAGPEATLRELAKTRHVVVFVENLNDLFRRIGERGQHSLRAIIQETAAVSLVATTPSLFPGVSDANAPFYGSFDTTHIDEMTLDEAQELLLRVAELREDSDLIAALRRPETRSRLRVIQALAGGHPRIWMLFADSLTVGAIDELVPLFLKMLDDLTPYYQERMRDLEGDQERIVTLLCDQLGALPVREIAERCQLDHRVASTAVGRLETKGFLRRASGGRDRRRAYYELREPLLRLCLQVKEARGKPVQRIVDFLRGWYDQADVWRLLAEVPAGSLAIDYLKAAFFADPSTPDALAGIPPAEARLRLDGLFNAYPDVDWVRVGKAASAYLRGDAQGALAVLDSTGGSGIVETLRLAASVRAGTVKAEHVLGPLHDLVVEHGSDADTLYLAGLALEDLNDHEGALRAFTRARHTDDGVRRYANAEGRALVRLGRFEEAVEALDQSRVVEAPSLQNRVIRVCALAGLQRLDEALVETEAIIAAAPGFGLAHALLGAALLNLDRPAEALAALDKATRLDPSIELAHDLLNEALGLLLPPGEDSARSDGMSGLNTLVEQHSDLVPVRRIRARALQAMGRLTEAREDLAYAVELDPRDAVLRFELAAVELELDNWVGFRNAVQEGRRLPAGQGAGDAAPYCRLTISRPDRVAGLVDVYQSETALGDLGRGLVVSIPAVADPGVGVDVATECLRAWQDAGTGHEEMIIPLRILAAAVAWKEDHDDAHLLRLPAEERAVLEPLLRPARPTPE